MISRSVICVLMFLTAYRLAEAAQPNILWLTSEDHGTHVGCYGDPLATTPTIDGLAARGLRFANCWSNAPVCAPARTTLITGLYGPSVGGEHMRSMVPLPAGQVLFPELLRRAGYYCSNNAKEDYNVSSPKSTWDESSKKAHWKNRPDGTPFFAVFNSEKSHESKLRIRPHRQNHDPARIRVPAYHPDTPEVRQDWAQYYDCVTEADADAGARLRELAAAGLTDSTIVFYFSDHGSGMPRNKRWPYQSGLHVPFVVYIPDQFRDLRPDGYVPGGVSQRLVSFVDFAPTVLSLAGIAPPEWMQGRAFLGRHVAPAPQFLFGFRGRMDERVDLVRSVTDGRYVYLRQYMPHLIYGQRIDYMFETPTTRVWKERHDAGQLNAAQDQFWRSKPPEELYDLQSDPDEVQNLAGVESHHERLERFRGALRSHVLETRDLGFLPEGERFRRRGNDSLYDMGHDARRYDLPRILEIADAASLELPQRKAPDWDALLTDPDSAIRYWSVLAIRIRGAAAIARSRDSLRERLRDESDSVAIAAASALLHARDPISDEPAMLTLLDRAVSASNDVFARMGALNALEASGPLTRTQLDRLAQSAPKGPSPHARYDSYVPRLLESLLSVR